MEPASIFSGKPICAENRMQIASKCKIEKYKISDAVYTPRVAILQQTREASRLSRTGSRSIVEGCVRQFFRCIICLANDFQEN